MRKSKSTQLNEHFIIRALRCKQAGTEVFSFFMRGADILDVADISRIQRDTSGNVEGFQRKEIKEHIKGIVEYLNQGDVIFPNAIILAVNREVVFKQARGRDPDGAFSHAQIGTLFIPKRTLSKKCAWIVDGQQRAIALTQTKDTQLTVPIVAFVAPEIATQRAQFILVNKAKPLPSRLINELLPEVDSHLPRDLALKRLPSELGRLLNDDPRSPFYKRIKTPSQEHLESTVISDTAVVDFIRRSINEPLGALASYRGLSGGQTDTDGMYNALLTYWCAVSEVFNEDWSLPPTQSRLTHSVGIRSMGVLMDRMLERYMRHTNAQILIKEDLERIKPHCRWTSGTWTDIGMAWNDIQNVSRHVRLLTDQLIRIDSAVNIKVVS